MKPLKDILPEKKQLYKSNGRCASCGNKDGEEHTQTCTYLIDRHCNKIIDDCHAKLGEVEKAIFQTIVSSLQDLEMEQWSVDKKKHKDDKGLVSVGIGMAIEHVKYIKNLTALDQLQVEDN